MVSITKFSSGFDRRHKPAKRAETAEAECECDVEAGRNNQDVTCRLESISWNELEAGRKVQYHNRRHSDEHGASSLRDLQGFVKKQCKLPQETAQQQHRKHSSCYGIVESQDKFCNPVRGEEDATEYRHEDN